MYPEQRLWALGHERRPLARRARITGLVGLSGLFAIVIFVADIRMASARDPWWAAQVSALLTAQTDPRDGGELDSEERRETRRRRRRKRRDGRRRAPSQASASDDASTASGSTSEPSEDGRRGRAAADRTQRILEGRKSSRVTRGTPSRWSNRGAMVPIVSEVPITQPLPARNVPRPAGVVTVGQRLQGQEPLLSARVSVGYYRLETLGQDTSFVAPEGERDETEVPISNNLDLLRARTTLSYQRIANSRFGLQVDAEFRPQLSGPPRNRPTDMRVNELFVSWGRTDWRRRRTGPAWGVAVGRVAIREAGYAQADGAAVRFRIVPELMVGAWGGVTGNPYGFNWRLQQTEFVSADWYTGGGFVSFLWNRLSVNVAGGVTIANLDTNEGGADRVFFYADAAYTVTDDLNLLLNGWFDVLPDGQSIQNVDLIAAYTPTRRLSFSASVGRFSTVVYSDTAGSTFITDPNANLVGVDDADVPNVENAVIVDQDGQPINTFDAALLTAVYNSFRVRAGYRWFRELETFVRWNTLLRDTSVTDMTLDDAANEASVDFASVRSLPTLGVRYRNPKIIDASAGFTYVIDEEATANTIVRGGIGREYAGLYAAADVRAFFGEIDGFDGGVNLSYTFPRSWTPGAVSLRGSFRYYRENVALFRPSELDAGPSAGMGTEPANQQLIPNQETFFGYAGIDWRY